MRVALWVFSVFCSISISGQSNFDLRIGSRAGYEYNVFNVNADKVIENNGTSVRALKSAYFQNVNLYTSWKIKSKHHEFGLNGDWSKDYFPQLNVANLLQSNIGIRYKLKMHKRHSLSINGKLKKYETNRPEDDTEVLRPPRAYNRLQYSIRYNLKLFSKSKIYIQATARDNQYITDSNREFYYNSLKYTFSYEQKLYSSKKISHSWNTRAGYETRFYNDIEYDELSDEESIEEREWRYYSFSTEYELKIKKKFKLVTGASAIMREDLIQNRFGYRQLQPYIKLGIDRNKINVSMKGSVARREFQTLKANASTDIPLIHNYIRGSLSIKYKVSKKLHFDLKARVVSRSRNLPFEATSFLAYDNALISLGVKYMIF